MSAESLPFELTSDSINNWLQSLSQSNSVNAANQLNKAIKLLKNQAIDSHNLLNALYQLTPTILYLVDDIELSLYSENNEKVIENTVKIEKLCLQLLRNTCLCFCQNYSDKSLSQEQQTQAIYFASHLIAYTQKLYCIFHESPLPILWKKLSEIYKLSHEKSLFNNVIKQKTLPFINKKSVSDIIKHNLLFSLLQPYRYNSKTIKQLFQISEKHAHLLELKTSGNAIFCWDMKNEIPPYLKNINDLEVNTYRYIDTEKLVNLVQSNEIVFDLDSETLSDSLLYLSGYKEIINSFIPSAPLITNIIVGQNKIAIHLEKVNKLNKIEQFSSQVSSFSSVENMALTPMEYEKNYLTPTAELSPSNSFNNLLKESLLVKVIRPFNDQYITVDTDQKNFDIGELILFCSSRMNPSLGIIRQLKHTSQSGRHHLLIEKVPGTPEQLTISSPAIEEKYCIVCHQQHSAEFFLSPHNLYKGTKIKSTTEQSFNLNEIIDFSRFYRRHKI